MRGSLSRKRALTFLCFWLAIIVIVLGSLVGCTENIAIAPKPAEADPQFVLERRSKSDSVPDIYVIRDKVNNKLIYAVPGCGIAVEDE